MRTVTTYVVELETQLDNFETLWRPQAWSTLFKVPVFVEAYFINGCREI